MDDHVLTTRPFFHHISSFPHPESYFIVEFSESWISCDIIYATKILSRTFNARCAQLVFKLNEVFGDLSVGKQRFVTETSKYEH